ncbi:MAG TPA: helix-turn-helix domain-containing protein [Spirochaetota bacterium]|nr:helix-turn-helix domain-containing protein [Spirochaetota bacterium]
MQQGAIRSDEILDPPEAARELKISPRTLARYRKEGRIPYLEYSPRLIKYVKSDIEAFRQKVYKQSPAYEL